MNKAKPKDYVFKVSKNFICDNSLSLQARMIYLILRSYADKSGMCFPSQNSLASITGIDLKTIRKYLLELEEKKFISVQLNRKGKSFLNYYRLITDFSQGKISPMKTLSQGKIFHFTGENFPKNIYHEQESSDHSSSMDIAL